MSKFLNFKFGNLTQITFHYRELRLNIRSFLSFNIPTTTPTPSTMTLHFWEFQLATKTLQNWCRRMFSNQILMELETAEKLRIGGAAKMVEKVETKKVRIRNFLRPACQIKMKFCQNMTRRIALLSVGEKKKTLTFMALKFFMRQR